MPCLGDEERVDPQAGLALLPVTPLVAQPFVLQIEDVLICATNRNEFERRMALHISTNLSSPEPVSVQISARTLKIGHILSMTVSA